MRTTLSARRPPGLTRHGRRSTPPPAGTVPLDARADGGPGGAGRLDRRGGRPGTRGTRGTRPGKPRTPGTRPGKPGTPGTRPGKPDTPGRQPGATASDSPSAAVLVDVDPRARWVTALVRSARDG
uniref:hypothetical protein n=1 Tax=Saccharothrix mutabilis TaxID=33921 RepID=UPI0031D771AC